MGSTFTMPWCGDVSQRVEAQPRVDEVVQVGQHDLLLFRVRACAAQPSVSATRIRSATAARNREHWSLIENKRTYTNQYSLIIINAPRR